MCIKYIILFSIIIYLGVSSCKTPAVQQRPESPKVLFGLVDSFDSLNLKTGDLLMFQSLTLNGILTQIGTLSPYTHCALVIRNPDGSLWLTHATDNSFAGERIPVLFEKASRSGIILTRLEDSFISTNHGKSGFYKHIRILRFDENWSPRPSRDTLLHLYRHYKIYPFTKSNMRFTLAAFDLSMFGRDLLSLPDDQTFFCSEYVHRILLDAGIRVADEQNDHEYTPNDIQNLEPYKNSVPSIFKFKNGRYKRSD